MEVTYLVAGYVKLAKLWERRRDVAIQYHKNYFKDKYKDCPDYELQGVYVDITGNKEIRKREAMLRLIKACQLGKVNCIATPTRAYLAANSLEFNYLLHYLFSFRKRIDIVTEDDTYQIDTIKNEDHQREALQKMTKDFVLIDPKEYEKWKGNVLKAINDLTTEDE
ncbi:MAG: hypothetical protein IKF90_09955 [Parasporobacterium sp.]|nr:hypothetical protein [Parasporobacterium sp.]